jgi:hypothetical protein
MWGNSPGFLFVEKPERKIIDVNAHFIIELYKWERKR